MGIGDAKIRYSCHFIGGKAANFEIPIFFVVGFFTCELDDSFKCGKGVREKKRNKSLLVIEQRLNIQNRRCILIGKGGKYGCLIYGQVGSKSNIEKQIESK